MDKLISADTLKKHYAWWKGGTFEMTMDEAKSDFDMIIDLQPTIDAEPIKHGRWIYTSDGMGYIGEPVEKCSVCGAVYEEAPFNYCPNCGAKMDGGEDDSK